MHNFNHQPPSYFWNAWKLQSKNGRHYWEFEIPDELKNLISSPDDWEKEEAKSYLQAMETAFTFDKKKNPNASDEVLRWFCSKKAPKPSVIPIHEDLPIHEKVQISLKNGFAYFETLQQSDGNWSSDYGGPLFLMPGLIIASYITETPFEKPLQSLIKSNLWNHQNEDGGWGLHIEGKSTMFGTVMQYVSLRILGEDLTHPKMKQAQNWILENGGATHIPQWGKFYLSLLNVYDWEGNDALLPELWKLPKWLPFHPSKYWCHNRMIFLPMSYCYGKKVRVKKTALIDALRKELYTEDFQTIDWKLARKKVCHLDVFAPIAKTYLLLSNFINAYENIHRKRWRKKSLQYVEDYIDHEDIQTRFVNVGPVNQALNSICVWHFHGKHSEQFKKHVDRWKDYLWIAEDGAKMAGYNGSQLWDTAFAGQALLEAGLEKDFPKMIDKIQHYIQITQIERNPLSADKFHRDNTFGCWPFSTNDHAWAVTDCTSEAIKTTLLIKDKKYSANQVDTHSLEPAVDWLLSMQNKNGGWASYEKSRAPKWIEILNPSALFENIMTEISYTECTSATIQGLKEFTKHSKYRNADIEKAIQKGQKYICLKQQKDGSWYGSWGVCFTYGTWFGIEGLIASGMKGYHQGQPSKEIQNGCEFLVSKQRDDGSWGEAFESCSEHQYIEHENGQIINTSWALLALMKANYPDKTVIEKGVNFILSRQNSNGDFPQEGISGVFNGNCMESYSTYRNIFPLWALGRFLKY